MKVSFNKLSNFLYDVLINGGNSCLSVEYNGCEFCCYKRDFLNERTRTLEDMRERLEAIL